MHAASIMDIAILIAKTYWSIFLLEKYYADLECCQSDVILIAF